MIDAIYRILYGEDWIVPSVKSIIHAVDRVFICWTDRPWGKATEVEYRGEKIKLPINPDQPYDGWRKALNSGLTRDEKEKVYFERMHTDQPDNQFTEFANRVFMHHGKPDTLICMEPDQVWMEGALDSALKVFHANGYRCAMSRQIELWKGFKWRVPERPGRTGTVFWNLKGISGLPPTRKQAEPRGTDFHILGARVHNLGFAVSEESMLRKHLIALAYSETVRDSRPNPDWFERKWKAWNEAHQINNLEISIGYENHIPWVMRYDGPLPEVLDVKDSEPDELLVRRDPGLEQPEDDQVSPVQDGVHMGDLPEDTRPDLGADVQPEDDLHARG
jgi:hypothetical protein